MSLTRTEILDRFRAAMQRAISKRPQYVFTGRAPDGSVGRTHKLWLAVTEADYRKHDDPRPEPPAEPDGLGDLPEIPKLPPMPEEPPAFRGVPEPTVPADLPPDPGAFTEPEPAIVSAPRDVKHTLAPEPVVPPPPPALPAEADAMAKAHTEALNAAFKAAVKEHAEWARQRDQLAEIVAENDTERKRHAKSVADHAAWLERRQKHQQQADAHANAARKQRAAQQELERWQAAKKKHADALAQWHAAATAHDAAVNHRQHVNELRRSAQRERDAWKPKFEAWRKRTHAVRHRPVVDWLNDHGLLDDRLEEVSGDWLDRLIAESGEDHVAILVPLGAACGEPDSRHQLRIDWQGIVVFVDRKGA